MPAATSNEPQPMPGILAVKRCFKCNSEKHLMRACPLRDSGPAARRGQRRRRGTGRVQNHLITVAEDYKQCGWAVDSGASRHVAKDASVFHALTPAAVSTVHLANNSCMAVEGQGSVYIAELGEYLRNVLLVPTLRHNLLSVAALAKDGYNISFGATRCDISKGNHHCASATLRNGLYVLDTPSCGKIHNVCENKPIHVRCVHLMHRHLGHCGFDSVQKTIAHACKMAIDKCKNYLECGVCAEVKSKACSV